MFKDTHGSNSSKVKRFQRHLRARLPNTLSAQGTHCSSTFNLGSGIFLFTQVQKVDQLRSGTAV